MRRIRILQLTNISDIGGAEQMVLNLAMHLDQSRFDVSIASLDGRGVLAEKVCSHNLTFIDLKFRRPLYFASYFCRLWRKEK